MFGSFPTEPKPPSHVYSRSNSGPAVFPHFHNSTQNPEIRSQGHEEPLEIHTKLWDEAYDELKRIDPELVQTYEKILSEDYELTPELDQASGNIIEQHDRTRRRVQMDGILRKVLLETTKPAGVAARVKDAFDVVLSLKGVIGNSLQSEPVAALAWTGVCIGLQASGRSPQKHWV